MAGHFYLASFSNRKRYNAGRLSIVKFNNHFCFSRVKTISNFIIQILKFFLSLSTIFLERFNSIQFLIHFILMVFFSGLICRIFLVQGKNFTVKCLNNFFLQLHWRKEMSKCIVTKYSSKFFNVRYFIQIVIKRFKDTIIYIISTVYPKIPVVQQLKARLSPSKI